MPRRSAARGGSGNSCMGKKCCLSLLLLGAAAIFCNEYKEWRSSTIKMTLQEALESEAFEGSPSNIAEPQRSSQTSQSLLGASWPEATHRPAPAPLPVSVPVPAPAPKPCKIDCLPHCPMSSRPWVPCVTKAEVWPYRTQTEWRSVLGDRVMEVLTPKIVEDDCDGYELFGDHSFCLRAMKEQDAIALSYGIEERDRWSEMMSNRFRVPPRLYDCFIPPERSPPISGKAPNNTGPGGCKQHGESICYEKPYQSYRVCFGPRKDTIQGRSYETLHDHLAGRGPLSTYVKIDTEGSEWTVLERLLDNQEDMDRIRTLDMEVHFLMGASSDQGDASLRLSEQDKLEREVRILERLTESFRCTGSTIEVYAQNWKPEKACPDQHCNEPAIHTRGGFNLGQFAVSFVNRNIFAPGVAARTGRVGPLVSAAAPTPPPNPDTPQVGQVFPEDEIIERPCTKVYHGKSSRPGRPCLPPASEYPFRQDTPWRSALGRRIWRSVTGHLTEQDCDGFELFGDSTWCLRAMKGQDVIGLSYGIEQRDLWSEKMSNVFHMPTRLYDCFIPPEISPPMRGAAPNETGRGGCMGEPGHCYEQKYEAYRVCLGPEAGSIKNRPYETLLSHLAPRGPLSTHVKVDTEGTEWAVLRTLLADTEAQDKIRTFEMEVHFSFNPDAQPDDLRRMNLQDRLTLEVEIMERLLDRFVVTGSTMEVYREDFNPEKLCPGSSCREPQVHIPSLQVDQFAVSYVHRSLLTPETLARIDQATKRTARSAPLPVPQPQQLAPQAPVFENVVKQDPRSAKPPGPDCNYECLPNCPASARPGLPCLPPAEVWPYKTMVPYRSDLGGRIFKAVVGEVEESECAGFELFGDHVFCKKAMELRDGALALSYGIEERDMWSEKMANLWGVPCRLFDCFQQPRSSPPISGSAPNATGPGGCQGVPGHCYEMPYQSFRICLGATEGRIEGRNYQTLSSHLVDRGPLSTYVKIDTEGSEWTVLERLLDSPDDIAKMRTLDMEVHFGFTPASDRDRQKSEQQALESQVRVMERLRDHFRVTGTTLENYRQGWKPEQDCATQQCNEPPVHLPGGFAVQQFAVSYVNKKLF